MTTIDDELQDAIERGELEPNKLGGTLADSVDIVRQSRERTAGVFPLPDTWDCVDYAITEIGEALDAELRMKRNGDKRNHDKEATPEHKRMEVGHAGYMLASALMQTTYHFTKTDNDRALMRWEMPPTLRSIVWYACIAGDFEAPDELGLAFVTWVAYCLHNGYEPVELLRETCAAFEAKHLPVVRGYDFELISKAE